MQLEAHLASKLWTFIILVSQSFAISQLLPNIILMNNRWRFLHHQPKLKALQQCSKVHQSFL